MIINPLILVLINLVVLSTQLPVTVPTYYNNYPYNQYTKSPNERVSQTPNSYYNRLTNNLASDSVNNVNNQVQVDEQVGEEYEDYEDDQTDKPVPDNQNYVSGTGSGYPGSTGSYNVNNLYNYWYLQNRKKHKKRRKRRPQICVPFTYTKPYSNHRFKRQLYNPRGDGKTFSLVLGDYNAYPSGGGGGSYGSNYAPAFDNVRPENDRPGQPLYNPYGGYPCLPVNFNRPHRPFGGGGGFFGNGGLFDFGGGSFGGNYGGGGGVGGIPPIRPPFGQPSADGVGGGVGTNGATILGTFLDKVNEFIQGIEPNKVIGAFSDALTGIGQQLMNSQPANVLREFGTLF